MTTLTSRDDCARLVSHEEEPGALTNLSADFVLLKLPSKIELNGLWRDFVASLREHLWMILSASLERTSDKYGALGVRHANITANATLPLGLYAYGDPGKLVYVTKKGAAAALVKLGLLSRTTPTGKERTQARHGDGGIVTSLTALSGEQKRSALREMVFSSVMIEDFLAFDQNTGFDEAGLVFLLNTCPPKEALRSLASSADEMLSSGLRAQRNLGKRDYATLWFSLYLASRGIWLLPITYVSNVRSFTPARLLPLSAYLVTPQSCLDLADRVLSMQKGASGTSIAFVLNVYVALAGSSTMLRDIQFPACHLVHFKEWVQSETGNNIHSSSANGLYRLLAEYYSVPLATRPEVTIFSTHKRLAQRGAQPFSWVFTPQPRNTRTAARCLGRSIADVPDFVKSWALQLRELLPLFGVKDLGTVVDCLDTWLIFLMTLAPEEVPLTFIDIDRIRHVNDMRGNSETTYHWFLKTYFVDDARAIGQQAITKLKQAFLYAAARDGLSLTCPFDVELDRAVGNRQRHGKTVRKPLDIEVWRIIAEENRRDSFGFSSRLGDGNRTWLRLRRPATDQYDLVHWPAEAVVIDLILHSAARNKMARWVDSGEGDEYAIDIETLEQRPNPLPTATPKRREGFLQVVNLADKDRTKTIGMHFNTNKTGPEFTVPWIHPELLKSIRFMQDLQQKYNPITHPIPARDPSTSDGFVDLTLFPSVYPLFRMPGHPASVAVTSGRVLSYLKKLLAHCQPIVEQKLGYKYPLVSDDGTVFDVHSLRVTVVSNLLDSGIDISIVQYLVGHTTVVMTWYYNARRDESVYNTLRAAFERMDTELSAVEGGVASSIEALAASAESVSIVEDHVGADLLREHRSRAAPIEFFAHGICPGGNCETGGARYLQGKHLPVWRPRACAGCRYRVTGPAFLVGLVTRLNSLTAEMRLSLEKTKILSEKIAAKEKESGRCESVLRNNRDSERSLRDGLAKEWALELRTIRRCEAMLANKDASAENLPARGDAPSLGAMTLHFAEATDFELFHSLVKTTELHPATATDVPVGTEFQWDRLMRKLLAANRMEDVFLRVPEHQAKQSFLALGDALLSHIGDPSELQRLLDGEIDFAAVPGLSSRIEGTQNRLPEA